jgi:uncharacterized protein YndB with AHSA1/START domain
MVDTDRIEREIVIQAPIEQVWATLTEAEHVRQWFAFDGAEVDLRPGGAIVHTWNEHGTFHARVEKVDPPRAFSYRWALVADEQPRDGNSTLVEFSLEQKGDGTRLRVVEGGFATLEGSAESRSRHVAENRSGWQGAFDGLQAYVAQRAAVTIVSDRP